MKTVAPDYYTQFKCIASDCENNCCHDWIITIDSRTARVYKNFPGPLGEKLRKNIEDFERDGKPCTKIRLMQNGKCPFLTSDNLCELVLEKGPDMLCEVCAGHPRFRNEWSCRDEFGLGIACQEAGRIILKSETPMNLVVLADDGEEEYFTPEELHVLEVRDALLEGVKKHQFRHPAEPRLMEYLIWHHISDAIYDNKLLERVEFVKKSFDKITSQWYSKGFPDVDALVEICHEYSRNVEHSAENMFDLV